MEVVEIISHHIDKSKNLIIVDFKFMGDDEDIIREDIIEYSFFEEFGFDNSKNFDIFESIFEDDLIEDWKEEQISYINNEDDLILFLNEYYVVYSNKIPKIHYK